MTKKLLYIALLLGCATTAFAQNKPARKSAPAKQQAAEKKPLRFTTSWHIFLSDSIPRPELLKILDSGLVVRDHQKNKFPVVSFDFTYEKKEPYVNDTTQEVTIATDLTGDSFKSDRLTPVWVKRLTEALEKGDVLFFNNIVIRYTGDKLYRAPELKIIVR
ncbi:hypothetical protein EGT74_19015 [Chitinophaga lutea]|uniref:Uncharacterized protein n=1 Tax=Chitinophaga lutea TaxID=2488634 RepID=A0A3N4PVI7_9BACT|nr:hypothetical protein [Chitinophaga lutea]RPE09101.1 hypothetical protein EGT74_19015 [Chitinophaga lutea]